MKRLYLRNTHNPDGSFREELRDFVVHTFGIGVHAFDPNVGLSVDGFINKNLEYYADNPWDHTLEVHPPTIDQLIHDLSELVKYDLVKVVIYV